MSTLTSIQIKIIGQVQGVGFRPFIYRIAQEYDLTGWVQNCSGEVITLVQGSEKNLKLFQQAISDQHPPLAMPSIESVKSVASERMTHFSIKQSSRNKHAQRHIPPDYFTCNDCLKELTDPLQRRYRYPFINCTQCGPRYTIIKDLAYDRPNTSLADFPLCDDCKQEYSDTLDRRFHAQPLACEECGPELSFFSSNNNKNIHNNEAALEAAIEILKQGKILAVKGIGGYHLICDASNDLAVQRLRKRKHRPHKPLAILFFAPVSPLTPSNNESREELTQFKQYCTATEVEMATLISPQRPIVLVQQAKPSKLAASINLGINEIGAMLAYSPLHYLLLKDFSLPLVATSGNISGEPVLIENKQAKQRLATIADAFLEHNRPILRPADDSVVRIIANKKRLLRIGRGLSPLELELPYSLKNAVLAVGGQMKNTIALAWGIGRKSRVVISPHIGELDNKRSIEVFDQVINDLCHLYRVTPKHIICDAHPDYYSTHYAKKYSLKHKIPLTIIQHHKAHASIVSGDYLINNNIDSKDKNSSTEQAVLQPWLVFSWDGTGLGDDKTIWGAEAFYGYAGNWKRVCSIKPFYLQGGDKVAKEPWRSACSLIWQNERLRQESVAENKTGNNNINNISILKSFTQVTDKIPLVYQAWKQRVNCIKSTSMGRLFDAASAILGLGEISTFEGQGAMLLESSISSIDEKLERSSSTKKQLISPLPMYEEKYEENSLLIADWSELLVLLSNEKQSIAYRSQQFHEKIAETLIKQAKQIRNTQGAFKLGLSGGVFQNKFLSEYLLKRLADENFNAFLPENIPYNDAGLAFGQIIEATHPMDKIKK